MASPRSSGLSYLALRVAVLKALADSIEPEYGQARDELYEVLARLWIGAGVRTADVRLPDGTRVASVHLSPGETGITVHDADRLDWVASHYPDEVETRIRPAFLRKLMGELEIVDDDVVHRPTGEVVPWALPASGTSRPRLQLRFAGDGRDNIRQAWVSGALSKEFGPGLASPRELLGHFDEQQPPEERTPHGTDQVDTDRT